MSTNVPSLSLHYLMRPPRQQTESPPLLLLLHGVGSDERDLFGLSSMLDERFLVISPRAPIALPQGGFGWYPLHFTAHGPVIEVDAALESQTKLNQFLNEVIEAYYVDPNRVYLMGFSQGGIMSLNTLLTDPDKAAGVVIMSARLLTELQQTWVEPEKLEGKPIIVLHGIYDPVLPIAYGRAIRDYLQTLPVKLEYHEYPMVHQVSIESLANAQAWLKKKLDSQNG
jgi:phospholipase/carboxylesterase